MEKAENDILIFPGDKVTFTSPERPVRLYYRTEEITDEEHKFTVAL